jgi:hypothetical protein
MKKQNYKCPKVEIIRINMSGEIAEANLGVVSKGENPNTGRSKELGPQDGKDRDGKAWTSWDD